MKFKTKIIVSVLILMLLAFIISGIFNSLILTKEVEVLRKEQIENTFFNYLNKINNITDKMQANASAVSRTGESIYELTKITKTDFQDTVIEDYLKSSLSQFKDILGTGLWYEPFKFGNDKKYTGVYAYWQKDSTQITWEYNTKEYDYPNQAWYTIAIPTNCDKTKKRENNIYVTPPYLDFLGDKKVIFITMAGLMYDKQAHILGISSTDWSLDVIESILSKFYITPNSFTFLIDNKTGSILYHPDTSKWMQQVSELEFSKNLNLKISENNEMNIIKDFDYQKSNYDIYYAINNAGFIFGIAVNKNEAYSLVSKVNKINILVITIILIISIIILYLMISRIMLPLKDLTFVVNEFSNKNFEIKATSLKNDEIGNLGKTFNSMADSIKEYTQSMIDYNKKLEEKVAERTIELQNRNEELLQQKEELSAQNEEINVQREELENQKNIIELNSKELVGSINYAKSIQSAILPKKEIIQNYFEHSIFYLPKSIVSGDFYWFLVTKAGKEDEKRFFALADCTGHGVPGAFMSMIGSKILDNLIYQKKETDPAQILFQLDKEIIHTLQQNNSSNADGMDIGLCCFEKTNNESEIKITFAGAKNDIYINSKSHGFVVFKGDRKNIGGAKKKEIEFTNQTITLSVGDTICFTTDGYTDQCNNARTNYGKINFVELIKSITNLNIYQQGEKIKNTFNVYKQDAEQRDDVTVIILKLK